MLTVFNKQEEQLLWIPFEKQEDTLLSPHPIEIPKPIPEPRPGNVIPVSE
jgi:hypothetical protein